MVVVFLLLALGTGEEAEELGRGFEGGGLVWGSEIDKDSETRRKEPEGKCVGVSGRERVRNSEKERRTHCDVKPC